MQPLITKKLTACFDQGNTNLKMYVFDNNTLVQELSLATSQILNEPLSLIKWLTNDLNNKNDIIEVGISSVVPSANPILQESIKQVIKLPCQFINTNSNIRNLINIGSITDLGSDLLASAVAGHQLYPDKSIIIFDLGSAITCTYIQSNGLLVGCSFIPGISKLLDAFSNLSLLPKATIKKSNSPISNQTTECMSRGVLFAVLGFMETTTNSIITTFKLERSQIKIIATGGSAPLFSDNQLFDTIDPYLVSKGILQILRNS